MTYFAASSYDTTDTTSFTLFEKKIIRRNADFYLVMIFDCCMFIANLEHFREELTEDQFKNITKDRLQIYLTEISAANLAISNNRAMGGKREEQKENILKKRDKMQAPFKYDALNKILVNLPGSNPQMIQIIVGALQTNANTVKQAKEISKLNIRTDLSNENKLAVTNKLLSIYLALLPKIACTLLYRTGNFGRALRNLATSGIRLTDAQLLCSLYKDVNFANRIAEQPFKLLFSSPTVKIEVKQDSNIEKYGFLFCLCAYLSAKENKVNFLLPTSFTSLLPDKSFINWSIVDGTSGRVVEETNAKEEQKRVVDGKLAEAKTGDLGQ